MIYFNLIDLSIIILFFIIIILIGFYAGRKDQNTAEDYLLSGRKTGLLLFILTNVSTWYGGILGVGEFTYNYGLVSWFTQGLPYYIFAFIFALFFSKKIRESSVFTISEKISNNYGKSAGLFTAVIVFLLVSPAPYLLMLGKIVCIIFNISDVIALILITVFALIYMIKGGFKSDLYTDAFQFFVMFIGFAILLYFSLAETGGFSFLQKSLPESHLKLTGEASPIFIIVWFLIALWTFADPGFHQRCSAAKTPNVARYGILISIFFWALFDFLTTSTGLFARGMVPGLTDPMLSYPILSEKILPVGLKGIFYAGLLASILSTFNSFLFLSGTTIGKDFLGVFFKNAGDIKIKRFTIYGMISAAIISIILSITIPSVIRMWYIIGSICIPVIIVPIVSSYYPRFKVSSRIVLIEMSAALIGSLGWFFIKPILENNFLYELEPMIIGLAISLIIHLIGLKLKK